MKNNNNNNTKTLSNGATVAIVGDSSNLAKKSVMPKGSRENLGTSSQNTGNEKTLKTGIQATILDSSKGKDQRCFRCQQEGEDGVPC